MQQCWSLISSVLAPRYEPPCSNHRNSIDILSRPQFQSPSFLLRGFKPLTRRVADASSESPDIHGTFNHHRHYEHPDRALLQIGAYITLVDSHRRSLCLLAQTCRRFYSLPNPQIMDHIVDCIFKRCVTSISKSNGREYPHPRDLLKRRLKSMYIYPMCKRGHTSDDIRCYRSLIFHARHIGSVTVDLRYRNLNFRALVCLLNSCIQRPSIELNITETSILSSWGSQYVDGPFVFTFDSTQKAVPLPRCRTKRVDSKRP